MDAVATPRVATGARSIVVPAVVAGAWAVILAADWTGTAGALHHHALIEGGLALPVATALFLAGWIVTVMGNTRGYFVLFMICGSAYLVALGVLHLFSPRLEQAKLD